MFVVVVVVVIVVIVLFFAALEKNSLMHIARVLRGFANKKRKKKLEK